MRANDLSLGLGSLLISFSLYYYSWTLPPIPGQIYGAGAFPCLIATGFLVCGIISIVSRHGKASDADQAPSSSSKQIARMFGLGGVVLVFTALAGYGGYLLSSFVMLSAVMLARKTTWWLALLAAALISLGTYVIFAHLLRVPLPVSLLEF